MSMIFLIKASLEKKHTKLEPQGLYFNIPYFSGEKDLHSSFSSIKLSSRRISPRSLLFCSFFEYPML